MKSLRHSARAIFCVGARFYNPEEQKKTLTLKWYCDTIPLKHQERCSQLENTELRYIDLKNDICRQIYEGVYLDGEKIPSERQMTQEYGVSRITVRKALELLEEEGLVLREVGNGTSVTLRNCGNMTAMDVVALVAPSKNPFFANFIAEFQRCAWDHDVLLLYVEAPGRTSLEDCLYRLYSKNIRNVAVWPDDRIPDKEKLLRLRSIGMNLVFFDTDSANPYADSVLVDNEDAVRELLTGASPEEPAFYIGWDNLQVSNIRKREECFIKFRPQGRVLRLPWRRDRAISEESRRKIADMGTELGSGMILCGTGEIGKQTAEVLEGAGLRQHIALAAIDDFEGSGRWPAVVYQQNLRRMAEEIYHALERQNQQGKEWKAEISLIKGTRSAGR